MGGRGASSGVSNKGKDYGSEFKTVHQSGNIKFVTSNEGANTAPMETMTKGRIYVTVDKNTKDLKYISYYDKHNKRFQQIDLQHGHKVNGKRNNRTFIRAICIMRREISNYLQNSKEWLIG